MKSSIPQRITRTCDQCCGDGTVEVECEDCGDELDDENSASLVTWKGDYICKPCEVLRNEDIAAAKAVAAMPLPSKGEP